jgi:hypothetical protein
MIGKLKDLDFRIGRGERIYLKSSGVVKLTAKEDHFIFGRRYQVEGESDKWFEANCFEWVEE